MHLVKNFLSNPLSSIKIDLIGVGGTGSYVLQGLAKLNLVHNELVLNSKGIEVNVYDPDIISKSNTVRQLFNEHEIGEGKAVTLVSNINRNYGFCWNAYEKEYNIIENKRTQVIILCPDSMKARKHIYNNLKIKKFRGQMNYGDGVYVVDFGNSYDYGQVFISFFPGNEKEKIEYGFPQDYLKTKDDKNEPSCSVAEALSKQKLFMNPTIANVGLELIFELLTKGQMIHKGVYVSLKSLSSKGVLWE